MTELEKVIKGLETIKQFFECGLPSTAEMFNSYYGILNDTIALLKEQEAEPPVHIYEEYSEHDWVRDKNGDIDDFAYDGDYHNGPMCKRCYYAFCIHCDPDGWNKEPCIIDEYKCPKCGRYIIERTKFCSNCGQAVKWE